MVDLVNFVGVLVVICSSQSWMSSWREGRDVKRKMSTLGLLRLLLVDTETVQVNLLSGKVEHTS